MDDFDFNFATGAPSVEAHSLNTNRFKPNKFLK